MSLTLRNGALLVALTLLAACDDATETAAPQPPAVDLAFDLIDETGMRVTEADFDGQLKLVFFGFTSCPDICPITLQNVAAALKSLGNAADKVTVLFVSIDPNRDTPERLTLYTDVFHPSVVGLTGTWDELTLLADRFRTTFGHSVTDNHGTERPLERTEYEVLDEAARYSPFHSSQLYVVGANRQLLDIIGYGSPPSRIESVLREYLD